MASRARGLAFGKVSYHSVGVRNGILFDKLHPSCIAFEAWKQHFLSLNNFTIAEVPQYFDFDTIPHPMAVTQ